MKTCSKKFHRGHVTLVFLLILGFPAAGISQTLLKSGEEVTGQIAVGGVDSFEFDVNEGDQLIVTLGEIEDTSGAAQPKLDIFGPDASELSSTFGNISAQAKLKAEETGRYSFVIRERGNDVGFSYRIILTRVPGEQFANDEGGLLVSGTETPGEIILGDTDVFWFDANQDDQLIFTLAETEDESEVAQPLLEVFGPDGTELASALGNISAQAKFKATESGRYFFVIRERNNDGNFSYRMVLTRVPGEQFANDEGSLLVSGTETPGEIILGDTDVFWFDANQDDQLFLTLAETEDESEAAQPLLEVFGPDGTELASALGNISAQAKFKATESGRYFFVIRERNNDGNFSYRMVLTRVPGEQFANDEGSLLVSGTETPGEIILGDTDVFWFDANQDDQLFLTLAETEDESEAAQPLLEVFGPDGTELASALGNISAQAKFKATESGRYFFVIRERNNDGNFSYRMVLTRVPGEQFANDEGSLLVSGTETPGEIILGDTDVFWFDANQDDQLFLTLAETEDESEAAQPLLEVFGPDGTELASALGNISAQAKFKATESGRYFFVIRERNNDGNFSYRMVLTRVPGEQFANDEGSLLVSGTETPGEIILGDTDVFWFDANQDDQLFLTLAETEDESEAAQPLLEVFGPDGTELASALGNISAQAKFKATESGRYFFVIRERNNDGNFSYRMVLTRVPGEQFANDEGSLLVSGTETPGEIILGDTDVFWFDAGEDDQLLVVLVETEDESEAAQPLLEVFGPDGAELSSTFGNDNTEVDLTIEECGRYYYVIRERRNDVNFSYNITLTHISSNNTPVLNRIGNKSIDEEMELKFTVTARDQDDCVQNLTFTLDQASLERCASFGPVFRNPETGEFMAEFSWTPREKDGPGTYDITVTVTDNGTPNLSDSEIITVTVNEINRPPFFFNSFTDNLEAYYPFLGNTNDESGNGNAGVVDNAILAIDRFDNADSAYEFNGTDSIIEISDSINSQFGTDSFSLSFWIHPDTFEASGDEAQDIRIVEKMNAARDSGWTVGLSSAGLLKMDLIDSNSESFTATASESITLGKWHHIVITVDRENRIAGFFVDGQQKGTEEIPESFTGDLNVLGTNLIIGAAANAFDGSFDDFTIHRRILAENEIANLHTINTLRHPKIETFVQSQETNEEESLEFSVFAYDPDIPENELTIRLDGETPEGVTISNEGVFSWTPTEAQGAGEFPQTMVVTDSGEPQLNDTTNMTVKVNEINKPPELNAIGSQTILENGELSFTATATDPDLPANDLTFSLDDGAPTGASITTDGLFSWTHSADLGAGPFVITVRVTDNGVNPDNLSDSETINVTISGGDSDQDSLPDDWELEHFGDLRFSADDDPDLDGISNLDEFNNSTNPFALKLEFFNGWNLFSLSLMKEDNSIQSILGDKITGLVWEWDGSTQIFKVATMIRPEHGYWVYSNTDFLGENAIEVDLP